MPEVLENKTNENVKPSFFTAQDIDFWNEQAKASLEAYRQNHLRGDKIMNLPKEMAIIKEYMEELLASEDGISRTDLLSGIRQRVKVSLSKNGRNPEVTLKRMWMLIGIIGIKPEEIDDPELPQLKNQITLSRMENLDPNFW